MILDQIGQDDDILLHCVSTVSQAVNCWNPTLSICGLHFLFFLLFWPGNRLQVSLVLHRSFSVVTSKLHTH